MSELGDLLFVPGPVNVAAPVAAEAAKPMISHRAGRFHEVFEDLRDKLRRVLRTRGEVVVFTASGTGAVEAAAANLARGRRALVPGTGEFSARLAETLRRHGAEVAVVEAEVGSAPSLEEMRERLEEFQPDIVAMVYNDTSPGVRLSYLRELCREAKSRGALTLVDAVSAVGGDELDVDEWGIDVLAGASQKCLAAPPGVSFISLSEDAVSSLVDEPTTFYFDLRKYLKFAERSETPFTPAVPLFYSLRAALTVILERGLERWIRMHMVRAAALYRAFEEMGFVAFVRRPYRSRTVLSFKPPRGVSVRSLRAALASRYGIYVAGGLGGLRDKIVRVGNMGPIGLRELITLVAAVGAELRRLGIRVDVGAAIDVLEEVLEGVGSGGG
ncbi:MAG: alanine--glyoxylate aminotransferase family protein [Thermoproteales archaeon]|nr:alanine--glyoxylate aminotransferase family protein [Thermoproteales archaeon]